MPKSTATCNSFEALVFNATNWPFIADNTSTTPNTVLYLSLHTANPGTTDNQLTSEATYTNYTRVSVTRTTAGWQVPSSGATSNAALVQFPQCGASGNTITYVGIGTGNTGTTGHLLYNGALNSSLAVANLIQPQFSIGALTVTET